MASGADEYPLTSVASETSQFKRWQWIEYDWIAPGVDDKRRESRRVQEDTILVGELMPEKERAPFLAPIITGSTAEAASKGMSLTLVRSTKSRFRWRPKTAEQIVDERQAYEVAAYQASYFDKELRALASVPIGV